MTNKEITLPTNWKDFGERVLRAAYTGAVAAAAAIPVADWTGLVEGNGNIGSVKHMAIAVLTGAATAAWTAVKAAVFQGRGSNPEDGSAK